MYNGIQFKAAQNIYCARTAQKNQWGDQLLMENCFSKHYGKAILAILYGLYGKFSNMDTYGHFLSIYGFYMD